MKIEKKIVKTKNGNPIWQKASKDNHWNIHAPGIYIDSSDQAQRTQTKNYKNKSGSTYICTGTKNIIPKVLMSCCYSTLVQSWFQLVNKQFSRG